MGRVVITEFVTLDGVAEDPGGAEGSEHGGWALRFDRGPEGDAFKLGELLAADALLLGQVTYEGFAAAWPSRTDESGFADKMNTMPKYVVSGTMADGGATWQNTTLVRGDLDAAVAKLKTSLRGDLLVAGSLDLVASLMANRLVDEVRLMVFPTVVGGGRRLFAQGGPPFDLVLDEVVSGRSDVLMVTYRPA